MNIAATAATTTMAATASTNAVSSNAVSSNAASTYAASMASSFSTISSNLNPPVTKKQRLDEKVLHQIYFCSSILSSDSDSGVSSNFGNTQVTHGHPKPDLVATFITNLSDLSKPVSRSNLVLQTIPCDIFDTLYKSTEGSFEQCPIDVATTKQGSNHLSALITHLSNKSQVAELKRDSRGRVPFIVPDSDEREIEVGEGEIKTRATLFICSIEVIVRAVKRAQDRAEAEERQRNEELKMSYITALHEQNSAASKIQSVIRMIKFKREFPRMKEEFIAARTIQSCMRVILFRRLMGTLSRFRLAATKVQSMVRMWKSKRDVCRIVAASFKQEVDTPNGSNDALPFICRSKDDTRFTAVTYTAVVLPNERLFYSRKPFPLDVSRSRLNISLVKTDRVLRQRNGVAVTGYPRELEAAQQQIISGTKDYQVWKYSDITSHLNEDGNYTVRKFSDCEAKAHGCYTLSTAHSIDETKSGSGCKAKSGMTGRVTEQIGPGEDPEKAGGVLSVLDETMELLESDKEAMNTVDTVISLIPWSKSYNEVPKRLIVNHLDECAVGTIIPGDAVLAGDRLLDMGSSSMHWIVRSPSVDHDNVANALVDTEQIVPFFTWRTEISSINCQVEQGETSTGRRVTRQTQLMVKDMVYLNDTFMKKFMIERLLDGISETVAVHDFVDAVPVNPIGDALAELAKRTRAALGSDVDEDTIHDMLRNGLEPLYKDGENFYSVEQKVAGDKYLLAKKTKDVLTALVKDLILSGKKTLILAENAHYNALKAHQKDTFEALFGAKKLVGSIYCANGREAGRLYRVDPVKEVRILVTGSYFVMNAPDKSIELRWNMCAEFLAIKWTLVQAKLMKESALRKSLEELLAYSIQLRHPLSHSKDTSSEMWAIRNNSPANYHHGSKGKKGLQALINILADSLKIKGIHAEVMASFAIHLGATNLGRLFAMLGHDIDCSNMAATLKRLKSEQKYRGGAFTDEHIQAISSSMRKVDTSIYQDVLAARRRQFDNLNLSPSQKRLDGIIWHSSNASWELKIPHRIFGKPIYIRMFTHFSDAKAAQKYLLKALKGLRARKPSSAHFDINNRRNKTIVDEAIKQVRLSYANDRAKIRDINIL